MAALNIMLSNIRALLLRVCFKRRCCCFVLTLFTGAAADDYWKSHPFLKIDLACMWGRGLGKDGRERAST